MAMPKITLTCPECGLRFQPKHHRSQFCTGEHAKAYNNRALGRGQGVIGLAMAWRGARSSKDPATREAAKQAFAQLCRELDRCATEDREAGRVHATAVYRRRQVAGLLD